jgi:serine/threonine-protein kinase
MIDKILAHFRVTAKLGEGGMGTVYRAQDTKLGRDVALKLLPEAFANDSDRMARFSREAQVLASLNHPNIAGIHSVEEAPHPESGPPVHFLVMELVEGETLQERIARGRLSFEEALKITLQIAIGLEEAH